MGSGHSAPAAAAAAFAAADANKDGKLDAKELGAAFEQIGVNWGAERVKYLLAALDPGSGVGQAELQQGFSELGKLVTYVGSKAKAKSAAPKKGVISPHKAPPDFGKLLAKGTVVPCDMAGPYDLKRYHGNVLGADRGYYDDDTWKACEAETDEWCGKQESWGKLDIHNLPDIQNMFSIGKIGGKSPVLSELRPLIDNAQQEMWRAYTIAYWQVRAPGAPGTRALVTLERASEYSEETFRAAHSGGKVVQSGVTNIEELYRGALKALPQLWELMSALRTESGEEGADASWSIKKPRRIWHKVHNKYNGDMSKVTDCARASLVFASPAALLEAATLLLTDPEALDLEPTAVVGYKNRVRHPTEEAYRDLLFTVRLADHVCEVQLHIKAMADAKKDGGSHRLFTLCRQVLFAPTVAKDTYTGERNADGERHGQGKMVYAGSGNVYDGGWISGKKEGRGTYRWADGDVFDGEYKGGKQEGRGTHRFASGDIYKGEYTANKREGRGTFRFANGDVYEGEFKGGDYEGRGTLRSADGAVYDGEWKADNKEGRGKFRFANGEVYEGEFKRGDYEGLGTLRFPDGDMVQGEFKADYLYNGVEWKGKTTTKVVKGKDSCKLSAEEAAERVKQLGMEAFLEEFREWLAEF